MEDTARSLTGSRWLVNLDTVDVGRALATSLRCTPLLGAVLRARGFHHAVEARQFLQASLEDAHDPMALPDVERAVERLQRALRDGEKIRVFGDYDTDGVTSTALLMRSLQPLGADVSYYIPHRTREGYGVNEAAFRQAAEDGVSVCITVDCGITAGREVAVANELGMDVIVTDHHEPPETLPPALAVVNPKRGDSRYPFRDLCGCALAFKLMTAMAQAMGTPAAVYQRHFLDLVALATVVDVVPLADENRAFVRHGLDAIVQSRKVGLQALRCVAGAKERLRVRDLGFGLGPRLNASGRIDDASLAVRLLLTADEREAGEIAARLDQINRERQEMMSQIQDEAMEQVLQVHDASRDRAFVLASPSWHAGVIGIVASRIVDAYHRPVLMIALDEQQGFGRGSGRSIPPLPLHEALDACDRWLLGHGGHAMAAGFQVDNDTVDAFRRAFVNVVNERLTDDDIRPTHHIDVVLQPQDLDLAGMRDLMRMEPCGLGNPQPVLAMMNLDLLHASRMGSDDQHLQMRFARDRITFRAVWWRHGALCERLDPGATYDVCFKPRLNDYGGYPSVELEVRDLRRAPESPPVATEDDWS